MLVLPLLLLGACGGGGDTGTATATPGASPSATELPEGFPADFPIYGNATITAASRIGAAQGDIFAIGMETADGAGEVREFYEERLAEAPWEVTNVVEISEENTVVVEFTGPEREAGTLAINEEQTDGHKTTITVSLPAPPSTATPTTGAGP